MLKHSKLLLFTALVVFLSFMNYGCDQPEDVVTATNRAYLTLNPERLPDNPSGTIYELWVANSSDTVSLGKFGYNFTDRSFLTDTDSVRVDGARFYLDQSVDDFDVIFVSIEPTTGDLAYSPESIMLVDFVSSQTIKLTVPEIDSIWSATVRYNMKSTSDGIGTTNDGSSIWFSSYEQRSRTMIDTTDIIDWWLDSGSYVDSFTFIPAVNIIGIDTSTIIVKDTNIVLGLDTLVQQVVRFDPILSYDTSDYYPTLLRIDYDTSGSIVVYDNFTQDDFALPNLSQYGWKYRGWIVSSVIVNPVAIGEITLPAWTFFDPILDEVDGGLLTTGVFYDIAQPDLENPHVDTVYKNPPRVPPFPGEDFLENLPAPVPNMAGSEGHVFVTLEPEFYNDSTNFPLLAFIGDLPFLAESAFSSSQGYTLTGYMYHNDTYRGFPLVRVTIERL